MAITKSFNDKVYEIVASIPKGFVMSYGQVARLAGNARASRAVGYAMLRCTRKSIPCHRVVYRDGALAYGTAFGGEGRQRAMLEGEGVTFTEDGRVDIKIHRHGRSG